MLGMLDVFILSTPAGQNSGNTSLSILFSLATLLPSLSVGVRRLHNVNHSGWWALLLLTIIGAIPLIYWQSSRGTTGPNNYGPDPLVMRY